MKGSKNSVWCFSLALLALTAGCAPTEIPPAPIGIPPTRMVGGSVNSVDVSRSTLTITTPMGQQEVIHVDEMTQILRAGTNRSLGDLSTGDAIRVDYVSQPDSSVLARTITIGYLVPRCSCGASCGCPISRGCKVVRY